ncbi:probable RNA-binding protein CG14230 [Colias croceus]|uniref:probable RNA-binding protein CG14230 n=1 Tax=Colias crocea TaxID=72248 RepID=UPI001E2801A0|nr:probable RNA-binding protein CG14230 [Colias croceus]
MTSITRLFVGNLPENANEKLILNAFSSYGDVTNIDIKCKPDPESDKKRFAFVTLSTSENYIESCLKHFSNEDFLGNRLYVTRARESFLERLQREREQAQGIKKPSAEPAQNDFSTRNDHVFDQNRKNKRKFLNDDDLHSNDIVHLQSNKITKTDNYEKNIKQTPQINNVNNITDKPGDKKQESEKKRLESMKRKRQEFKEKKLIIKTGLTGIDKVSNKKIIFTDTGEENISVNGSSSISNGLENRNNLFDDEDSDDGINFNIKEQFEGKKGQKVLDLQSRYKSDKRFVLDERFADESDEGDAVASEKQLEEDETVELERADEKSKQVKILQDVLGVAIRSNHTKPQDSSSKTKAKLGMLRFDPLQPDHAKFLAPVEPKEEVSKKSKKKKSKDKEEIPEYQPVVEVEKVEVSKEQFYEVSDVLKEAIAQPTSFSLRSLFSKREPTEEETPNDTEESIPLVKTKDKKVKHPLDPGEKNPFVYDSSESEDEGEPLHKDTLITEKVEPKAVWRENLFLSLSFDNRLKEGLEFFNQPLEGEIPKERRQLKSVMKKRLYNKERKNKMFQKKIGGRKKTMKKSYNKKS